MIAKRQTTGKSFLRVFETVTIICLNPLRETIVYFAVKKDEVLVHLRKQTGFKTKTFYFETVDADVSLSSLSLAFYYTTSNSSH